MITIDGAYSTATTGADGLMSSSDKTKLDGISPGAEVNVQSDWTEGDSNVDSYILNKPTIPTGNQIIDWTTSGAGTIHSSNISSLSLSNVYVVTNGGAPNTGDGASAALGDVVISIPTSGSATTYIRTLVSDPSLSTDYTDLQMPTTTVTSVNNNTGVVTLTKSDIGLTNVENTALSTWSGNTSITSMGTIATGTWDANTIQVDKGGTGQTYYTDGQLLIGNTSGNTLSRATLSHGTNISITNGNGTITIDGAYSNATTGADGLMSSGDKTKLDQIIDWTASNSVKIDASNIPILNQNTTGSAGSLSTTLSVATGGTGQTSYEEGQLLIGNTAGSLTKKVLTQGSNVSITNGDGMITIDGAYSTATTGADGLMSSSDKTKLDGISPGAEVNVQSDWTEGDSNVDSYIRNKPTIPTGNQIIDWTASNAGTIHATNTPTLQIKPSEGAFVDGDKDKLDTITDGAQVNVKSDWNQTNSSNDAYIHNKPIIPSGNQIIDWTVSNAGTIDISNIPIPTLQPKPSEGEFVDGDKTKLDGIDTSADVTDTINVRAAGALMVSDFTSAGGDLGQLKAFSSSNYATAAQGTLADNAQQPPSEGAFENGDKTKLNGISHGADVTDRDKVILAGALMVSDVTNVDQIKAFDASLYTTGQLSTGPGLTGGGGMSGDVTINLDLSTHDINGDTSDYVSLPTDKIFLQSNINNSSKMPKISTFLTSIAGNGLTSDSSTGTILINNSQSIVTNISDHFRIYSSANNQKTHYVNIGKGDSDNIRIKSEYKTSVDLGIPSSTYIIGGRGTTSITISNRTTTFIPSQTNVVFTYPGQTSPETGIINTDTPVGSTTISLSNISPNPTPNTTIITVKITPDNYLHKTIIQTQSTNTNNDASIQFDIGNKTNVTNIDNDGLTVKKGFIESINIINGGSGYASGDTVVIAASPFGTTYTAEAKITVEDVGEVSGVITNIEIIKSGIGYSSSSIPLITVTSPGGGQNVSLSPQVNDSRYIIGQINNFNARYDGYFKDLYISGDQNFQGTLKVTGQGAVELGKPSNLDFSEDDSNFLFGYDVGRGGGVRNTTNKNTTLIGYKTGFNSTTSSEFNTFCGSNTGYKNTSGTRNTYLGYQSGYTGTTTTESVSVGNLSGAFLEGSYNTSVGANSGYGSSNGTTGHSGNNNVYLGYKTESRGGSNNLFAGSNAGELSTSSDGVFLGYQSGKSSTGNGNVLIGYQSGYTTTTSLYNVLIGYQSGYNISTNNTGISGNYTGNITLGYKSGYNLEGDSSRNIIIGPNTGPPDVSGTNTHHNKLYISTRGESLTPLILGDQDTINSQTLNFNADVTISGTNSDGTLTVEGGKIVFWGQHYTDGSTSGLKKKWKIESPGTTSSVYKDTNIQIVDLASGLPRSTGAFYNTLMGVEITTSNAISDTYNINDTPALTGSRNSIYGGKAFYNGTSGLENTMVGYESGYHTVSGQMNTFIGSYSGRNMTGHYNTTIGARLSGFASSISVSYKLIIDTSGSSKGTDSLIYGNQSSSTAQTLSFNAAVTISKESSAGTLNVEGGSINIHGPKRETDSTNGKIWALKLQNGGQYTAYKDTNLSLTNHTNIFNESEATTNNTYLNILIGHDVGKNDGTTNGRNNVLIGHRVAENKANLGEYNVAIGAVSQRDLNAATNNTSCGYASLMQCNSSGGNNSVFGSYAAFKITSGNSNSIFGKHAGYNITTGDRNICIGHSTGPTTTDGGSDSCIYIDAGNFGTVGKGTNCLIYANQSNVNAQTLRLNADVTIHGENSSGNLTVGGTLTTGSLTTSLTATGLTIQDINIDVNPSVGRTSFDYNLFFTNNSHNVNFTGLLSNTFFGTYGDHLDITNGATGNSAFGYHNLVDLTNGDHNTSIGISNNTFLTTGSFNVALGSNNLRTSTASNYCIGIGTQNFYLAGNGSDNICIGRGNCYYVSGDENVGIGHDCLKGTSSDGSLSYCVGIGFSAGKESTGNYNHFMGYYSGYYTTGSNNVGIGDESLRYLRGGSYNIGIGHEACRGYSSSSSSRTFTYNIGLGRNALTSLSTGNYNVCMGYFPGHNISTGHNNVCLGQLAGYVTSSGYNNIFLGRGSGRYNTTGHSNISIGFYSGRQTTGSKNISIGYDAGPTSSEITNSDRLYIDKSRLGSGSLIYGNMSSRSVTINGSLSITGTLITSGSLGSITADITGGVSVPSNKSITIPSINQVTISGSNTNMYLGYQSAFNGVRNGSTTGNTYFGYRSGRQSNTAADHNTYIGMDAGYNGTSAELSTAIGSQALYNCSTGFRNTCLGYQSGYHVKGSYNTCIGYNAGPTGSTSAAYYLYIDPYTRKGDDSLIYGYGHPTSTLRSVKVNGKFEVKEGYSASATEWKEYSDISLKKDIFKIDEYINDKIDLLEPVLYTLKSNDKKAVGFIAQEVKKIFPLLVSKDNNGILAINYSKLTSYLVKGAQENNKKIKELESKINEEKEKRETMEKFFKEEIEKLRKEILRK